MRRLLKGKTTIKAPPQTPPPSEEVNYTLPVREIFSDEDMPTWQNSEAQSQFISFVLSVNEAVQGKQLSAMTRSSKIGDGVVSLLDTTSEWVGKLPFPPQAKVSGNAPFKAWYKKLKINIVQLLRRILDEDNYPAILELASYVRGSFGDEDGISYGVGHEMTFAMFICCLFKVNAIPSDEMGTAVLKIFNRYWELVRKLIRTYKIHPVEEEDARTSIDDYYFLPYLWGSSQLIGHKIIIPEQFLERKVANIYANDYVFMRSMQFLYETNPGEVNEHSGHLWILSGFDSWKKLNDYLMDMFQTDILGKVPIIRQLVFGTILPISSISPKEEGEKGKDKKDEFSYVEPHVQKVKPSKTDAGVGKLSKKGTADATLSKRKTKQLKKQTK